MMKRSIQVSAPLLASAALALTTGCRKPEMQRCVDEQNRVVPDSFCKNSQQQMHSSPGVYIPMYRYYYGGFGGYGIGSPVNGGSYSAIGGHSYSSGTSRGGFGSSFGGGDSGDSGGHGGSSSGGGGE